MSRFNNFANWIAEKWQDTEKATRWFICGILIGVLIMTIALWLIF